MKTIILSGGDLGGRTITGNYAPGQKIEITENGISYGYRVVNGQAVFDGSGLEPADLIATLDPEI